MNSWFLCDCAIYQHPALCQDHIIGDPEDDDITRISVSQIKSWSLLIMMIMMMMMMMMMMVMMMTMMMTMIRTLGCPAVGPPQTEIREDRITQPLLHKYFTT